MTKERLVEKTRKLLEKWGVKGDEADKFIADLEAEDEEEVVEETEIEEATEETETETEIAPEEEEVEEKVEEEVAPVEEETTETEETIEEAVEEETAPEVVEEEAKEEAVEEHEEADKGKWEATESKFTALDGEIATLKEIINELRDRVEGGAFGTTAKLPPMDDDEWEGEHTKAYFKR